MNIKYLKSNLLLKDQDIEDHENTNYMIESKQFLRKAKDFLMNLYRKIMKSQKQ